MTYILVLLYSLNGRVLSLPEPLPFSSFLDCSAKALQVKQNVESLGGKVLSAECVPQNR